MRGRADKGASRMPAVAASACVALLATYAAAAAQTPPDAETQLRQTRQQLHALQSEVARERRATASRLDALEQRLEAQTKLIDQLTGTTPGNAAAPAAAPGASRATAAASSSAATTAAAAPPPSTAVAVPVRPPATEVTAAAAPAAGWSPSQPIHVLGGGQAYLNLALDSLFDFGWSTTPHVTDLQLGDHDPNQRGFTMPNTELAFDGAVDPYFTGFANIVFKLDEHNDTEVELEEAYLTTTSLPANLQLKGGQFLTEFGRQNQQHPHAWDFVDLPLVLARILGPEGLRNPGARLSWLTPTPFYSEALLGVMDSHGDTAASFRDEEHGHFGRPPLDIPVRSPADLLFVPRYVASFDLTDSQTLVAGVSGAFGPNASGHHTDTEIYGADLYWKWKPSWQSAGWPFLAFQTEGLYRRYEAGAATVPGDDTGVPPLLLPRESLHDWGVYAQALYGFRRRWVAGLRGEYVSGDEGAFHDDPERLDRFRLSPNLTFYPTEFSKLRLQWNYDHGQLHGDDHSVWLQTEFLLGAHGAHKF